MEREYVDILDEMAEANRACLVTYGGREVAVLANGVVLLPKAFTVLLDPREPTKLESLRRLWR